MKKVFSISLIVGLIMTNCLVAFAASGTYSTGTQNGSLNDSKSIQVDGTYDSSSVTKVYSVTISWEAMTYQYTPQDEVWNPNTHAYEVEAGNSEGSWTSSVNKVTVVNHSNDKIGAKFSFAASSQAGGNVTANYSQNNINLGTFSIDDLVLNSAVGTTRDDVTPGNDTSPKGVVAVGLTGKPDEAWLADTSNKIGDLTLTITNR